MRALRSLAARVGIPARAGGGTTDHHGGQGPPLRGLRAGTEDGLLPRPAGEQEHHCPLLRGQDRPEPVFLQRRGRRSAQPRRERPASCPWRARKSAIELAQRSVKLNPGSSTRPCEWVQEDVFTFLEGPDLRHGRGGSSAVSRGGASELEGAVKGYLSLFSSASGFSPRWPGFPFLLLRARSTGRPSSRSWWRPRCAPGAGCGSCRELHADVDHPVAAAHPEGEYLKGWMVHAE